MVFTPIVKFFCLLTENAAIYGRFLKAIKGTIILLSNYFSLTMRIYVMEKSRFKYFKNIR